MHVYKSELMHISCITIDNKIKNVVKQQYDSANFNDE